MKIIDIPQRTLDLLQLRVHGDEPWPEPELYKVNLAPVPPFEPALLPNVLGDFVIDAAHRMQAPPEFIAVSCLVSLGAVVGAGCAVRPKQQDDWSEHPNLWGAVIGGPATMKSPAISSGCEPISWLESEAHRDHEARVARYLSDKDERDYELSLLKSASGREELNLSADDAKARSRELRRALAEEPKLRRYRTNDATVEKLGEVLCDNPRGLLVIRDELVGLLEGCNRQGHESDRSFYLEAWNGKDSHSVDRIGRGSIVVPRLCLAVFGGIQPARLQDYVWETVAGHSNDGLLQRFQLMVYPDVVGDFEYVDQEPDVLARDKVVEIFRKLAGTDFGSLGATANGDKPPYFRFSRRAQRVFVSWLTRLEARVRCEESGVIAEHIGKYRKLVPALSLIFHLVNLADSRRPRSAGISLEALKRAIAWSEYLEPHARRVYGLALDPLANCVDSLAKKLKAGDLQDGFSERDVYKSGWSNLTDREAVRGACRELEDAGWIRRIPVERGNGRPPSTAYRINPKLKK